MRNILYLIIIIICVGLAVAYSVNIFKGQDITTPPVTVNEQPIQVTSPQTGQTMTLSPHVALPIPGLTPEENLYNRIDSLERNLNNKLSSLAESSDNKEVISRIDQLSKEMESDVTLILSSVNKKEQWYRNEFYQVLMAIGAAFVALTAILIMMYISLKKFTIKATGLADMLTKQEKEQALEAEANPVLTAVNKISMRLASMIADNRYLFDPDKAVRLTPQQKNALTEITDEIIFLDKAGNPMSAEEYYLLGLERFSEKFYDESDALFDHIKSVDDSFSLAWFMTGYTAYLNKKYEESRLNLMKACELEPENVIYLVNFGNICLKLKNYDEGAKSLEKAANLSDGDYVLWNNLAHAYILAGETEKAAEAFNRAIEIRPDFHEALHNLGLTYSRLNKYADAAAAFEKAIEVKQDKHESMYNAACVYAILGKREEALKHLKKAIELSPDYAAKAKDDRDFDGFTDDAEFNAIIS